MTWFCSDLQAPAPHLPGVIVTLRLYPMISAEWPGSQGLLTKDAELPYNPEISDKS